MICPQNTWRKIKQQKQRTKKISLLLDKRDLKSCYYSSISWHKQKIKTCRHSWSKTNLVTKTCIDSLLFLLLNNWILISFIFFKYFLLFYIVKNFFKWSWETLLSFVFQLIVIYNELNIYDVQVTIEIILNLIFTKKQKTQIVYLKNINLYICSMRKPQEKY